MLTTFPGANFNLGKNLPNWQSNYVLDIRLKAPLWIQIMDVRSINVLIILASALTFDVLAINMLFSVLIVPLSWFCCLFCLCLACIVIGVCLFDNIESWDGEGGAGYSYLGSLVTKLPNNTNNKTTRKLVIYANYKRKNETTFAVLEIIIIIIIIRNGLRKVLFDGFLISTPR